MKYLLMLLFLAACHQRDQVTVTADDGKDGDNGHSIVSLSRSATGNECGENSGSSVDFYLDQDNSNSVTEGDQLQSGVVACNGSDGQNGTDGNDGQDGQDGQDGEDGTDGEDGQDGQDGGTTFVMVAIPIGSSCVNVAPNTWAKKQNSQQVVLYDSSSCGVHDDLTTLDSTSNEVYVVNNTTILILDAGFVIRKLTLE